MILGLYIGLGNVNTGTGGGVASIPYSDQLNFLFRADQGVFSNFAGTTAAVNDDYAKRWNDTSGDFALGLDSTSAPIFKTAQLGSFPAIRFNGTTNYLAFLSTAIHDETTTYAVLKRDGAGVLTILSGPTSALQYRIDDGYQRLVDAGTADIGTSSVLIPDTTWSSVNMTYDAGLADGTFRVDGTAAGSVSIAGPAAFREQSVVGCGLNGGITPNEFFKGDIFFLAQFSGIHTTGEREAVEAWITSTFGV
jgi:hypothetical protein